MDKPRKPLAEQLRTLSDPPVGPYPVAPQHDARQYRMPVGHWRTELSRKPNAWRRFCAWAFLGWRWHQYPD